MDMKWIWNGSYIIFSAENWKAFVDYLILKMMFLLFLSFEHTDEIVHFLFHNEINSTYKNEHIAKTCSKWKLVKKWNFDLFWQIWES